MSEDAPTIVIGVPGPWSDETDLHRYLRANGGLVRDGVVISSSPPDQFDFELYDRDVNLTSAFRAAGGTRISEDEYEAITRHRTCVYLLAYKRGSEEIKRLVRGVTFLLQSGGIAAKIESCGLAHSSGSWKELSSEAHILSLYRHFVVVITEHGSARSCGMHQFGLPDAQAVGRTTSGCSQAVDAFCRYLLLETPTVHTGHTFSTQAESQLFTLALEDDNLFPQGDLFWNPFGRWQLRPPAA